MEVRDSTTRGRHPPGGLSRDMYVTPNHQMRHKLQIQKLGLRYTVTKEDVGYRMANELCFYHN